MPRRLQRCAVPSASLHQALVFTDFTLATGALPRTACRAGVASGRKKISGCGPSSKLSSNAAAPDAGAAGVAGGAVGGAQ
eukprot:CAMPEP_0183414934 /NCGR_PEP_ID=MMETSP0370-20130417/22741_1 /TAXON_ID=268820 /ORGANISM="Peridinium aciculiferum, Strain PAER-2" /LENGTH=79 /DNA_ID=CAMNT_0025598311 /DNA_START=12 /DNA_END=249 /DNA_ORIENTATION=-